MVELLEASDPIPEPADPIAVPARMPGEIVFQA